MKLWGESMAVTLAEQTVAWMVEKLGVSLVAERVPLLDVEKDMTTVA